MPSHVKGSISAAIGHLMTGIPELDDSIHKAVGKRALVLVRVLTPVSKRVPDEPHHLPGRLQRSWRIKRIGNTTVLYTRVPYAAYVEYDTAPHAIVPKKQQALRFRANGKTIFAKRVMHPGTTGHFMLTKTVAAVSRELTRIGDREVEKWARRHGF